jgi:hypothetical protein
MGNNLVAFSFARQELRDAAKMENPHAIQFLGLILPF